jgi:replicative DNA helicase
MSIEAFEQETAAAEPPATHPYAPESGEWATASPMPAPDGDGNGDDGGAGSGDASWRLDTPAGSVRPASALDVLLDLHEKVASGDVGRYQPVPLGFMPLDRTIGTGLRPGEMLLLGGAQGTGKTTMCLQMARNVAAAGQANVLYICFEHDEEYLLNRLIALESVVDQLPSVGTGIKLQDVRQEVLGGWEVDPSRRQLSDNPRLRAVLERIARYGRNLYLMRGSQTTSTVENMRLLVQQHKEISGDRLLLVFVDYLQKVPVIPDPNTENEKVTIVVNGLKDVALAEEVPLVAIVAADKEGLKAARLRNHHLRGSSAINYEADIILILNEKYHIVHKSSIEYNPYMAQRFRDWVVTTVEKNRGGRDNVDMEFEKHFEYSCFDPNGRAVQEKLVEERLYQDT